MRRGLRSIDKRFCRVDPHINLHPITKCSLLITERAQFVFVNEVILVTTWRRTLKLFLCSLTSKAKKKFDRRETILITSKRSKKSIFVGREHKARRDSSSSNSSLTRGVAHEWRWNWNNCKTQNIVWRAGLNHRRDKKQRSSFSLLKLNSVKRLHSASRLLSVTGEEDANETGKLLISNKSRWRSLSDDQLWASDAIKLNSTRTYPANNPRPRRVGVESEVGPDCGWAFDVFLSPNFPNIPDIFVVAAKSGSIKRFGSLYVTETVSLRP